MGVGMSSACVVKEEDGRMKCRIGGCCLPHYVSYLIKDI